MQTTSLGRKNLNSKRSCIVRGAELQFALATSSADQQTRWRLARLQPTDERHRAMTGDAQASRPASRTRIGDDRGWQGARHGLAADRIKTPKRASGWGTAKPGEKGLDQSRCIMHVSGDILWPASKCLRGAKELISRHPNYTPDRFNTWDESIVHRYIILLLTPEYTSRTKT